MSAHYDGERFYGDGDLEISLADSGLFVIAADIPLGRIGNLVLTKSAPDTAAVGSRLRYTLIYANNGAADILNVALVDTLPPEVSFVSADQGVGASGDILRWDLGDLTMGEQDTAFVEVEVDSSLEDGASFANTAYLSAEGLRTAPGSERTVVRAFPRLVFAKTADLDTVQIGDTFEYTLVVGNLGRASAVNVAAIDTLSSDLNLISVPEGAFQQNGTLLWPVGDLAPGEADTLRVGIEVPMSVADGQPLLNRAWVIAENARTASDSVVVLARSRPDLRIFKGSDVTEGHPGETVTYTLVMDNRGAVAAREVTVEDRLPSSLEYVEETGSPDAAYSPETRTLVWSLETLARGDADTLTFQVRIGGNLTPGVHAIENTAQVLVRGGLIASSDPVILSVLVPYLQVEKSANKTVVETGDLIRYGVTVTNTSASDSVYEIQVEDHLPHSFDYVDGTTLMDGRRADDPSGVRSVTWELGDLGPSDSRTLYYIAVVGADVESGDAVNEAVAHGRASGWFAGTRLKSGSAHRKVMIRPSLFARGEVILGKVWVDVNGNRIHDDGERTVPGAVLMLEDGTRVTTDEYGNYSIPEVKPGDHAIWLLEESLPSGVRPVVSDNAFAGDPLSQFVSLPKYAMAKANFMLTETAVPFEKRAAWIVPDPAAVSLDSTGNPAVGIGDPVRFDLAIRLPEAPDGLDVTLTDPLPEGLAYVPGSSRLWNRDVADPAAGSELVWTLSGVPSDTLLSFAFDVRVSAYPAGGVYTNVAHIRAVRPGDNGSLLEARSDVARVRVRPSIAELTVRKRVVPGRVVVPVEREIVRISAAYFETGSATIRPDMQAKLKDGCAHVMDALQIRIEGHTDSRPIHTKEFWSNRKLSEARAESVLELLAQYGIERDRMTATGYGPTRPVAPNDTEEGRTQNRRVEVIAEREESESKGTVTYELRVHYAGEEPLREVVLVDSLPSSVHLLEGTASVDGRNVGVRKHAEGYVEWDLGDLSSGQEVRVRFDAEVEVAGLDSLVNAAYVRYGTDGRLAVGRFEAILYIDREDSSKGSQVIPPKRPEKEGRRPRQVIPPKRPEKEERRPRQVIPPKKEGRRPKQTGRCPYVVHLSSYIDLPGAHQDVSLLKREGYDAFVAAAHILEKGMFYRALVGGFATNEDARRAADRLRKAGRTQYAKVLKLPYTILLGSFSSKEEPEPEIQKLRARGISSHSVWVRLPDGGEEYGLFTGAFATQEDAESTVRELKRQGISGQVVLR